MQDDLDDALDFETTTTESTDAEDVPNDDPAFATFLRFSELILKREQLAEEEKALKEEMAKLQPRLLAYFQQFPNLKMRVNGVTIFPRGDIYVASKEKGREGTARVIDALRDNELGHYVFETYSVKGLAGYVRELERNNIAKFATGALKEVAELLPPALRAALTVHRKYTVQGVRSKNPKTE